VVSRNGFSPFYLGSWRRAANARSYAIFHPADFFTGDCLTAAVTRSEAGRRAAVQDEYRQRKQEQHH
jgi:hypothetical protein